MQSYEYHGKKGVAQGRANGAQQEIRHPMASHGETEIWNNIDPDPKTGRDHMIPAIYFELWESRGR